MSGGNAVSAALRQPAPEPVADHLFELSTLRPVRLPRSLQLLAALGAIMAALRALWPALGPLLGRSGRLLGRSRPLLGRPGPILGTAWGPLGRGR